MAATVLFSPLGVALTPRGERVGTKTHTPGLDALGGWEIFRASQTSVPRATVPSMRSDAVTVDLSVIRGSLSRGQQWSDRPVLGDPPALKRAGRHNVACAGAIDELDRTIFVNRPDNC